MLATYVKPEPTLYSLDDLALALRDGFTIVTGAAPADAVLAVLLGQTRLETGNGQHCWNGNLGNIKRSANEVGMFTCITLNEVIGNRLTWFAPEGELMGGPGSALKGERIPVPDGHPQTRMAALENSTEAGRFYVNFLAGRSRYAAAWQAALAGNPEACSIALGRAGYYTAPIEQYTKTFVALFNASLARIRKLPHEEVNQPSKKDWQAEAVAAVDNYDVRQSMLDDKNAALNSEDEST